MDIKKIDKYTFLYQGIIKNNGIDVYVVEVNTKSSKSSQMGRVYIDASSLAIIEFTNEIPKKNRTVHKKPKDKSSKKPFFSKIKPISSIIGTNIKIEYRQLPNQKWALFFLKLKNRWQVVYKKESFIYDLTSNIVIDKVSTQQVLKVKNNYGTKKDFTRELDKIDNVTAWGNNYKLSLSADEKRILNDIEKKKMIRERENK